MKKINLQKGIIQIPVIAAIVIIVATVVSISIYETVKLTASKNPVSITPALTSTLSPTSTPLPTLNPNITADWKTYSNKKYGFTVKYPQDFKINEQENTPQVISVDKILCCRFSFDDGMSLQINYIPNTVGGYPDMNDVLKNKKMGLSQETFSIQKYSYGNFKGVKAVSIDNGAGLVKQEYIDLYLKVDNGFYSFVWSSLDPENKGFSSADYLLPMLSTFKFTETDAAADWKTYTNKDYGFNFKYPAEFISADANLRNETLNYLDRFGATVNMLALSKSAYPKNTDLARADILIAVNKDISGGEYFFRSVDKSRGIPPPEIEKLTLKKTTTINGIVWGMAEKEGAAAGTHSRVKIYHTFQNGTWYEVQLNFWTANDGNIAEVNENDIWNKLESMLSTFKFTK